MRKDLNKASEIPQASNEEKEFMLDAYNKLMAAEAEIKSGKTLDVEKSMKKIRKKFDV